MHADALRGTWEILSWRQVYDDGRVSLPLGSDPSGVLHYDADRMICLISRRERAAFTTGGQWSAEAAERAGAYSGFLAYTGTYAIEGDRVHHYVELSLFPNWVGTDQVRTAELVDGRLYLTARLEPGTAEARTAELVWQRAAGTATTD